MSPKLSFPDGVHPVRSRGRVYYYFQAGRNTAHQGPRIRLPDDPQTPEFWQAVRQAQGLTDPIRADTVGALIDAYESALPAMPRPLSEGTQKHYRRHLKHVRKAWGDLPAASLRPSHVQALIEQLGATRPGTANNTLDSLRAMCRWAMGPRELLDRDPTQGVQKYAKGAGYKPWTPQQLEAAEATFSGPLRRAYMLARWTGQRVSDVVRFGWTDVDDGGFSLPQTKTGVQPWCPIFPELAAEMQTWEKRPGPFVLQDKGKNAGKPVSTNLMWRIFNEARKTCPELEGAVWHGLRANAVIRLRQHGYTGQQMSDMVGMSVPMIERYCRHADRKASGLAVLKDIQERNEAEAVKHWKTVK